MCIIDWLFSMPGLDGEADHYLKQGISQSLEKPAGWEALYRTIEHGVPGEVQSTVDDFLERFFHRRNREGLVRAREVMELLLDESPANTGCFEFATPVAGKISFIIPSGHDGEALMASLVALADKVELPDWEAIVALHDPALAEVLAPVAGDLAIVTAEGDSLGALYNAGASVARGEYLVFLRPGVLYYNGDGLIAAAAARLGAELRYQDTALAFNFRETFYDLDRASTAWRRTLRFFAKWRGQLPKDEDFMMYAMPYYERLGR